MPVNVLVLSTYPFQKPRHGGQVRLSNIVNTYRSAGFNIVNLAVYEQESYGFDGVGGNDVVFPKDSAFRRYKKRNIAFINDFLTGEYSSSDDGGYQQICEKISKNIDVIHLEQPWLLPLVIKLTRENKYCAQAKVIYGSQNIEYDLKKVIFNSFSVENGADVLDDIRKLESEAAQYADLSLAVTMQDAKALEAIGAQKVLIAPNGAELCMPNEEKIIEWKKKLPASPWLLFIASAHPPNITGFIDGIGDSLACVPPDTKIVIAGGAGPHIFERMANNSWRDINVSRLQILGVVEEQDIAALKELAYGFLLPVLDGGGSNIKTAEALYSGKPCICTTASLRGFEEYQSLASVTIANIPEEFQRSIRNLLGHGNKMQMNSEDRSKLDKLLWSSCLAELPGAALDIIRVKVN